MICTSDLEKLQKRSAGQFNIVHLTTILKIYRNDDLPPGIHAQNSLNSPYLLMFSPFFLQWMAFTSLGVVLVSTMTFVLGTFPGKQYSYNNVYLHDFVLLDFMFKVYSNIALSFFTEFQPQSESGIPPEYPKERMIPIGCQVDQKIFQNFHYSIFIISSQFIYSF